MAATTKPRERLAIYKALAEKLEKLAQELRMNSYDAAMATELLSGPILEPGENHFAGGTNADEHRDCSGVVV